MEKNTTITNINTIGKVGSIFTLIFKIILIIGLVFTIIGTTILFVIPKDLMSIKFTTNALVDFNLSSLPFGIKDELLNSIEDEIESEHLKFTINDQQAGAEDISVTENGLQVSASEEITTIDIRLIAWICLFGAVTIAILLVTVWFIGNLFTTLKNCETPFCESVIKALKHLAFSLIPWAFLPAINNNIATSFYSANLDFSFSIDLGVALIVIAFFILVQIFKYGAQLQKESDETL